MSYAITKRLSTEGASCVMFMKPPSQLADPE